MVFLVVGEQLTNRSCRSRSPDGDSLVRTLRYSTRKHARARQTVCPRALDISVWRLGSMGTAIATVSECFHVGVAAPHTNQDNGRGRFRSAALHSARLRLRNQVSLQGPRSGSRYSI